MHIKLKEMDQIKLHMAGFLKRNKNTQKKAQTVTELNPDPALIV